MRFHLFLPLAFLLLASHVANAETAINGNISNNKNCIACHQSENEHWQQSDHAKAMAVPSAETVKGDFNQTSVKHYGQKALFFIKDKQYKITISYDEEQVTYPVKYTFGYFPLQQYLVETDNGQLQVLPFAWDARNKEDGGQRWYHNYSHEEIRPDDRLHWRQPLQNWNGMCADCHSNGLKRNYNAQTKSFKTTFEDINVSCLSCHGDMPKHQTKITAPSINNNKSSKKSLPGLWMRDKGQNTAHWEGVKRDNSFMDTCFGCHSLRSPLTDGFKARTPFLEQFMPQLPSVPNYHVDGQIKEEVYVYGSFLQSKMFSKGVNCLDCHDNHTMKLKVEGNGLCLQCHGAEIYNVKSHHQHSETSAGAQCVNCHMPTTRYMGVDDRRDHSFNIPRPLISAQFGSPNACISCHQEKSNQWASEKLVKWHGKVKEISSSKRLLMTLNSGQPINFNDHLSIIEDNMMDVISRASALQMLNFTTQEINADVLKPYLSHSEALIRLGAASAGQLLSPADKVLYLSPLLTDKFKAIRIAAVRHLVTSPIAATDKTAFNDAINELFNANEVASWRGEGRVNQGLLAREMAQPVKAEHAFKEGIKVAPYFDGNYINLADLYRVQQRTSDVNRVLAKGMAMNPTSASLHYAFGLHLVRTQQHANAIHYFERATSLDTGAEQYLYAYILSLDSQGDTKIALNKLQQQISHYQQKETLKELGLYLSKKMRNRKMYDWFMSI
jgi:predicted CXXCH cytochrome family protein